MTIRGSRRQAATMAAAFAVLLVILVVGALLLGLPSLLGLIAVIAPIQLFFVVMQLRPTSLSFDGADVVYRVGGRETRTARKDIAGCAQVGQRWVFSNSSGAQLFVLSVAQFAQADLASFCSHTGLNLQAPALSTVDKLRQQVRSAKGTFITGLVLTIPLLVFAGWAIWASVGAQENLRSYQAAPVCPQSVPAGSTCRLQTQALVTSTKSGQSSTVLHLTLKGTGGDYSTAVNNPAAPRTGDVVDVELWSGKVTRVAGNRTFDNPEVDPNLNITGVVAVIGIFVALTMGMAVVGYVQMRSASIALRTAAAAESGAAQPVQAEHPDAPILAGSLPPCGIAHYPKEQFFAHWDPKAEKTGLIVASVIAVVVLAILAPLAYYVSVPIFGGIAALGLAWFGLNVFGEWRERRVGGVFADDLHVGKITTSNGRFVRKVYPRTSVLECTIGAALTVVGVDGSTLFWTGALSPADVDRFVAFLGCRVVRETPPAQPDSIASPPVQTPLGVLPLRVRRAAGLMQAVGGLMVGLGLINVPRMLGLSPDLRTRALELLATLVIYGVVMLGLGSWLARGRPHGREAALIGSGIATILVLLIQFAIYGNPTLLLVFAAVMLPVFGLVFYWLREPVPPRPAQPQTP